MVKQTIQIYARLKPAKGNKKGQYEISEDNGTDGLQTLSFSIPRDATEGYINNKKELYKFGFQQIFDTNVKQEEIFEAVARPVIDNVLQGYNGTIFAYGQTGSGKTFTITGGAERYADRGIIPRSLSYIFEYYDKNKDSEFTTQISYFEIYNENGYDLLDPKHEAAKLDDLPRVTLMEDADQNIHLKNLSSHQASNEEEALNLLFVGDTNRMIAECMQLVEMARDKPVLELKVERLQHSERVSKTGVNGLLLTEAKYINLSLHYLEQVIIALSENRRQHIPYRNSMMTSVLRDSLGGNCMTTMIATCATERANVDETISTCRFAQRVALIRNDAILNEELDPRLMIEHLKRQVQQLKDELAMATGESRSEELTEQEAARCEDLVRSYLADNDPDAVLPVGADLQKIHFCFRLLKRHYQEQKASSERNAISARTELPVETVLDVGTIYDNKELQQLKDTLLQRDNEISILCKMLRKAQEKPDTSSALDLSRRDVDLHQSSTSSLMSDMAPVGERKWTVVQQQAAQAEREERHRTKILGNLSVGRQEAFELFQRDYEHGTAIKTNKQTYKQLCVEAKRLGEQLAQSKATINKLKGSIKQYQASLAVSGAGDIDLERRQPTNEELRMMREVEEENMRYKDTFNQLRALKTEIEHLQHLLEISKVKLMKDFEAWWSEQSSDQATSREPERSAWQTPPPNRSSRPSSSDLSRNGGRSTARKNSASSVGSGGLLTSYPSAVSAQAELQLSSAVRSSPANRTVQPTSSNISLTGDADADADIAAFMRARQNLLRQAANRTPQP